VKAGRIEKVQRDELLGKDNRMGGGAKRHGRFRAKQIVDITQMRVRRSEMGIDNVLRHQAFTLHEDAGEALKWVNISGNREKENKILGEKGPRKVEEEKNFREHEMGGTWNAGSRRETIRLRMVS